MAGKQFRLTLPDAEATEIRKQAEAEGFGTPQKLILDRLRRFNELESERDALLKKVDETQPDPESQIQEIAITKTQEVLEVIKDDRHELLMLYAFRFIFPAVPADVMEVMTAYKLTPGVFYMRHVCEKFPQYVEQIKQSATQVVEAEAEVTKLKQEVPKIEAQRDEFEQKFGEAEDKAKRLTAEKLELLKPIASYLGVPDTVGHIVDRIKEIETEAETLQGLQAEVNEKGQTIVSLAEQRDQAEYDRDFYKNKSVWRKLREWFTGEVSVPPKIPRNSKDDDIPF